MICRTIWGAAMGSDLSDLEQAANALKELNQHDHAHAVYTYIDERVGWWPTVYRATRELLYWALLVALLTIGFVGAAHRAIDGAYFTAIALLLVVVVVYGFIRLTAIVADRLGEHAGEMITEVRIEQAQSDTVRAALEDDE